MNEVFYTFKTLWEGLSTSRRVYLVSSIIFVVAVLTMIVYWSSQPKFSILYSGLDPEEAVKVTEFLTEKGVAYELSNNGQTIMVPGAKVHQMRLQLATEGIPRAVGPAGGLGFEILDKPTFGLSDRQQNINYYRALQGEIARTIRQIEEVKEARVLIVVPERKLFTREQPKAKASVFLKLDRGRELSASQVRAIRFLVSNAVEGLDAGSVSIVDSSGRALAADESSEGMLAANNVQLKIRKDYEEHLTSAAQRMLDQVLGLEQSSVRVSAEMDFDVLQTTSEIFDTQKVVVSSEKTSTESNISTTLGQKDPAGVTSNTADAVTQAAGTQSKSEQTREDSDAKYEIPRSIEIRQSNTPKIKRLSVAVFVNKKTDASGAPIDRTPEELKRLEDIVRQSVGLIQNQERNDSITIDEVLFADNFAKEREQAQQWTLSELEAITIRYMPYISQGFLVILALAILLFFRSVVKSAPKKDSDEGRQAFQDLMMEVERLRGVGAAALAEKDEEEDEQPKHLTVNELSKLIQENPDNTSIAIRQWLAS